MPVAEGQYRDILWCSGVSTLTSIIILYVNYSTVRVVSHTPSLLFRFGKGPEKGKTISKFIEYRVCVCVCVCVCACVCVCVARE